jgi:hypothetical protein
MALGVIVSKQIKSLEYGLSILQEERRRAIRNFKDSETDLLNGAISQVQTLINDLNEQ